MKTTIFQRILFFQLVSVSAIIAGCSAPAAEKQPAPKTPEKVSAPSTFALEKGSLAANLKIPAELTAYRQVDLYAKVNSYVQKLHADVGSKVKAGELLVNLEAPELISQVSSAESKLRSQEAIFKSSDATYQRVVETSKTPGTISKNDVEIALAKRNSDLAQLQAAQADYKSSSTIVGYLTIRAPFDGVISARNVNLGAYTGPSGKGSDVPIFTLQELKHLRLVVSVPEAYKSYIRLGDVIKFTVQAYPGEIFSGKIARRSWAMDTQLRSEHIELDVANRDNRLTPGMVAEAELILNNMATSYVVPKTAVLNSTEGVYLIADMDGKAKRVPVQKGRETDSVAEVFGQQLTVGALFVKKASEEIHNGAPVK